MAQVKIRKALLAKEIGYMLGQDIVSLGSVFRSLYTDKGPKSRVSLSNNNVLSPKRLVSLHSTVETYGLVWLL